MVGKLNSCRLKRALPIESLALLEEGGGEQLLQFQTIADSTNECKYARRSSFAVLHSTQD